MKKLLAIGLLLSVFGMSALAQQSPAPTPEAQKGRELLERMIAALGGQAYLTYASRSEQGRTYSFYGGRPSSLGVEFWNLWQYPDKLRTEVGKKREVAYVYNGNQGYEITYRGTAALGEKDVSDYLRRRAHSLEIVLRQWLPDPKTMVFYAGPGTADNRMVDLVSLLNARNESVTIAIDPTSNLPVRTAYTYRDPLDNLKSEETEVYANFHREQGIMTPYSIVRTKNGEFVAQRFLTRVEFNSQVSSAAFDAKVTYDPSLKGKR